MRSLVSSRALVASQVALVLLAACGGGGGGDAPPGDTSPPALVSVTPTNTATDVAVSATVGATFSEPLACATITAASFQVTGDGVLAGSLACAGATVTFTPAVPLERGRFHTARITTAVTDVAGNHLGSDVVWAFIVVPADTTPPTVLSTVPADGAAGVSVATEIRANLSEPVDCDTATSATFTLAAGGPVSGLVGCQGAVVTFSPRTDLQPSTTYTATLTTGLEDAAGNALAAPHVYTFTTGAPPDVTRPTVVSSVPTAGGLGFAVDGVLSATFSEAMVPATLTSASFTLRAGATDVAGSVGYAGLTATFTPSAPLAPATVHTATVTTAATDLAGNALGTQASWTFTTADAPGGVRVLFERNGDLYSVREDGSGVVRFTNTFGTETFVGVGPGGEALYQVVGGALFAVPSGGPVAPVTLAGPASGLQYRGLTTTGRVVHAIGADLYAVTIDGLTTSTLAADPAVTEEDPHFAPGGRVVFRSQVGGNIAVVSVADDGTDRIVLDGSSGIKTIPFITSTGRVYVERVLGSGFGDHHDLWSVEADGSLLVPIAASATRYEGFRAIAPDGTLVYDYCDLLEACGAEWLVVGSTALNLDRGTLVGITAGNRVVYTQGPLGGQDIRSITTGGADVLVLSADPNVNELPAALHPGGRVVYRTFDGVQSDLRSVDAASADVRMLASTTEDELFLGVAPGGRVVYGTLTPSSALGSLHSVEADGTDPRLLADAGAGGILFQGFTSTGKVAYTLSTPPSGTDLYLVGHDGAPPVNLTKNPSNGTTAFFSSVP